MSVSKGIEVPVDVLLTANEGCPDPGEGDRHYDTRALKRGASSRILSYADMTARKSIRPLEVSTPASSLKEVLLGHPVPT